MNIYHMIQSCGSWEGGKKGSNVRLISCHLGKFADGAAQKLASYLEANSLMVPTDKVKTLANGAFEIFNNGKWVKF